MIKNLLLLAFRNIVKDKAYSLINILGLTFGITCSIFLLMYVLDEMSFDKFHDKSDRIYLITSNITQPDKAFTWISTQPPAGPTFKEDYPVVENYVRLFGGGRRLFRNGDKDLFIETVFSADSTLFDIFTFNMLEGNPETALEEPMSLILTEDEAVKFFGTSTGIVGKTLESQDGDLFNITGVIENVPFNSDFRFDALTSLSQRDREADGWGGFFLTTFIVLNEGADVEELSAQLPEMYTKYMEGIFGRMNIQIEYELVQLERFHLYFDGGNGNNIGYVYTFIAVGILMLLIASINYMNLATARSSHRAKEVGIRKVLGSNRGQLIGQFITESVLMTTLSLTVSILLFAAFLPFFNDVSGKNISFNFLLQPNIIGSLFGILILVGILGGSYPAFFLSGFKPVTVLKGKLTQKATNILFRKGLVVLQFTISLSMLISTWIVYDQLSYMQNKDLGYDKEHVLTVRMSSREQVRQLPTIKDALLSNTKVKGVATSAFPISSISSRRIFYIEGNEGMEEKGFIPFWMDHDYVKDMGLDIIEGRDFSIDIPADTTTGIIVNEATVKLMNWENPLGKKVRIGGAPQEGQEPRPMGEVVGVVKDFHQNSLYSEIDPMVIMYYPRNGVVHVKLDGDDIQNTVSFIENKWKELFPETPFEYSFIDQDFAIAYEADMKRGQIFTAFAGITIFIACLGLLGLASYTAEQRTKEIGVRKVIGATVGNIVFLISKDFLWLVLISVVFASPLAYYFMQDWLDTFAFKTEISVFTFIYSTLTLLGITLATITFRTVKAAIANPIKSLRDE